MNPSTKATVAAMTTVVLWASSFPFIRIALRTFEPIPLASLRFTIAAVLMAAWWACMRPAVPRASDAGRLLLCAAIGIAFYNMLLNTGQRTVSAAAASFIVNTVPVITALIAVTLLNERLTAWAWLGSAISFAGVALIANAQPGGLRWGEGAVLVLLAALCQAVYFVLQRPLLGRYGAGTCAAAVVMLGAMCLAPWLPAGLDQARLAPTSAWVAVIVLGVFPAAIGYATWSIAQAHFGPSQAANFLYLVPPLATALALLLAGEWPSGTTLLGGALAILGVAVVNTRGRRAQPAQP